MVAERVPDSCHRCGGDVHGTRWVVVKHFDLLEARSVCDGCAGEIDARYRAWKAHQAKQRILDRDQRNRRIVKRKVGT